MLGSLAQRLSLFEKWLRLFPKAKYSELSQSIEDIYLEYIAFIVNSIKYFRRSGLQNLLRTVFWPPLTNNFDKSNTKIHALTEFLVLQVQTASYESAANRDQEMRHLLRATQASSNTARLKFIHNASRNENFFGRADVIGEMSRLFKAATERQVSVALHGPPGVGKSQIAIEYLYRNFNHYPVAIWLDGRDRLILETQFIQIARQIGCMESGGNHCSEVLSWINCNWLVIFDNVDDVNDIRPYWPAAARGSVIITSRDPTACEEGLANKGFPIEPFSPSDGADFILSLSATELPVDEDTKRAAFALSEAFDGLPLGLKVAVSTMARRNYTPTQFAAALAKSVEEAERQGIAIRKEVMSLADLFDMVLQSLHPAALALLDMVSFLNPKGIPVELFESNESSHGPLSFNFRDGAESLWTHSLLRFDNNKTSVTVHGYTQSYVYRKMRMAHSQSRHDGALCKVLVCLERAVPELVLSPNRNPSLWERRERYLPHVWSLASRAKDTMPKDSAERLIGLMTSYG
ncbi:hypothetical protein DL771_000184 [Monosporascus sp. 5C6A]|nr:hypothetical protein DL771_000184 [Monosporascus sp. 5C6A]